MKGACDTHFHVFGLADRYPARDPKLRYKPPFAPLEEYLEWAEENGFERFVFVQPSAYLRDNSCMLDAMRAIRHPCRGIVDIDEDAGIQGRKTDGTGADPRGARSPDLGQRPSPHLFRRPSGPRRALRAAQRLGAGRGHPQENPGRQPEAAFRLLEKGSDPFSAFFARPRGIGEPLAPRAGVELSAGKTGELHGEQVVAGGDARGAVVDTPLRPLVAPNPVANHLYSPRAP